MARNNHQKVSCDGKEADNGLEAMKSNLVPRGRAPFGQHQESRPLARSNDIPVLNGFVNTIDWDQNQSDLSDLALIMRRVTGSPWIADFRCQTQVARGRDSWFWQKGARPLGMRMSFPRVVRVLRMLAMVLKWLTDFFTGLTIGTRKAARSKVAASPPPMMVFDPSLFHFVPPCRKNCGAISVPC